MKISVFGLGYVGAVTSACFAKSGHRVIGVDIDRKILAQIDAGNAPIVEEGLSELIQAGIKSGRLSTTSSAAEAVGDTEISIVCVGTPSSAGGLPDLSAAEAVVRDIGTAIRKKQGKHVVIIRSTVLPGTTESRFLPLLEQSAGRLLGDGLELFFNPEFLREGVAVNDFFAPPFIVIGGQEKRSFEIAEDIYKGIDCAVFKTSFGVAESVKYLCNAFQATKIAFANEAGALLRSFGLDGRDAMRICCEDRILNISPAYLRPGYAFGGSCLPKDLRALAAMAAAQNTRLPLMTNILTSNEEHIKRAFHMVVETGKSRVGMLGIAFKPGTNDLRESGLLALASQLVTQGCKVAIYDPDVKMGELVGDNRRQALACLPSLAEHMTDSLRGAIDGAEVIVVGNATPSQVSDLIAHYKGQPIIDLQGVAKLKEIAGNAYRGICW